MALFLGFPISLEFHARVAESIRRVRQEPPASKHRQLVTDTIIEMTETGITFFFSEMVGRMQLGSAADRVAGIALKTVRRGLHLIIERVGWALHEEQFYPLVDFLETIPLQDGGDCYVAFPATPELEDQLNAYIDAVHNRPPATDHAWQCHDLIVAFKHASLDYYFRQSTKRLGVHGWAEKAVVIGINIADGASNQPLKRVIPQLSEESLISIADFYRGIMLEK